ncbi:MAG TPA: FAD/NAD(P)-binding oxidoreductase [Candidatus Acidoferrales bacterium]|nr:FAD/NAD(P)-binding oxidoreductase [Candidatus Acidoferrales bacterium]
MSSNTVVVLGGGVGGMVAANELCRQLPGSHRVVLIERNARYAFPPSFLWVMTGEREPEQICRPLATLLRPGIEFMQAEVIRIDSEHRKVQTTKAEIPYDKLIVALGADLAPDAIPGLMEASHTFFTFDGVARLRDALRCFSGGRIAVLVSAMPYKCPGAPHEGSMLIADFFRERGLSRQVEIHLFTPEAQPMPVAGPHLGEAVRGMLQARGIQFHPLHQVTRIEPNVRELIFENG